MVGVLRAKERRIRGESSGSTWRERRAIEASRGVGNGVLMVSVQGKEGSVAGGEDVEVAGVTAEGAITV